MAQTNYTPISLYYSTTASAVPTAANLVPGELAINTNDGKLYYEDSSGVVQVLATKSTGSIGGSTTQVQYNLSGSLAGSANLTFDGTNLTTGGTNTATRFIPSGSTVATNGMYLPAANTLGFSTNSTERMRIDSSGNLGLGVTPNTWTGWGGPVIQMSSGSNGAITAYQMYSTSNAYYSSGWKYVQNGYATYYLQAIGYHAWFIASNNTTGAGATATFTQAMTLDASGGLQVLNTIGVGNTAPSTSGAGITFPATQNASSNANTLDDYEEGTWTPAGGSLTNNVTAKYTKIGNFVYANFDISFPGGGAVAQAQVSGMPFTSLTPGGGGCLGSSTYAVPITLNIERSNTFFVFSTFGGVAINYSDLNGARLIGTLIYVV